jgi:hypothetical protein
MHMQILRVRCIRNDTYFLAMHVLNWERPIDTQNPDPELQWVVKSGSQSQDAAEEERNGG